MEFSFFGTPMLWKLTFAFCQINFEIDFIVLQVVSMQNNFFREKNILLHYYNSRVS